MADGRQRAVAEEWRRRVDAEYRSAVLAHGVTLGLLRSGAPPDLIRDGLRIVDDELTHSELSWDVARAAGAEQLPSIEVQGLSDVDSGPPLLSLAVAITRFFCIGETVAVPLFRLLRRHAEEPCSQRALDAILRDEGRHRQFGWDVLDWLLATDPSLTAAVAERLPSMLAEVRAVYGAEPDAAPISPATARWGLASPSEYARVLDVALEREVEPRFAARAIVAA